MLEELLPRSLMGALSSTIIVHAGWGGATGLVKGEDKA